MRKGESARRVFLPVILLLHVHSNTHTKACEAHVRHGRRCFKHVLWRRTSNGGTKTGRRQQAGEGNARRVSGRTGVCEAAGDETRRRDRNAVMEKDAMLRSRQAARLWFRFSPSQGLHTRQGRTLRRLQGLDPFTNLLYHHILGTSVARTKVGCGEWWASGLAAYLYRSAFPSPSCASRLKAEGDDPCVDWVKDHD